MTRAGFPFLPGPGRLSTKKINQSVFRAPVFHSNETKAAPGHPSETIEAAAPKGTPKPFSPPKKPLTPPVLVPLKHLLPKQRAFFLRKNTSKYERIFISWRFE
ncbi:MAG: hypothetical protein D6714_08060 [Bacteroidetes bacterium]|nr:MAG: hypothetical protein D6714_08060 [Bacteroidota bacterium]